MALRPLQVTATTPHGVALGRPWGIPLDALLASVLWNRRKWAAREAGTWLTYHHDQPPQPIALPLAVCGNPDDDDWHWMATFADMHPRPLDSGEDPDVRWRISRTDRQRLQQLAPVIGKQVVSHRSGRYQTRFVPAMAHLATTLTWRAVGDPDVIGDLLAELGSIGKHRGVGQGVVTRWDVTETPDVDEWSAGHEHEPGVLGRAVPTRCLADPGILETGALGVATIRPPYLHPASRGTAYNPAR